MKHLNAVLLALCAGIATFSAQHYLFPAPLHAAGFVVPRSADWRQQMIDRDPGGAIVDRELQRMTDRLDLTADQAGKLRPMLERQHERILAVLLTAPASLTRDQFMAERQNIRDQMHHEIDALLTPEQVEMAKELRRPTAG
jgi:Spy/CpxP family protein refolding chaperone